MISSGSEACRNNSEQHILRAIQVTRQNEPGLEILRFERL